MKDIYFESDYCKINETIEGGIVDTFEYESQYGNITYNFIKRKVEQRFDNSKIYYDITSPYGYGGPVINECYEKESLIEDFKNEFSKYCTDNNIVSEFVRFHPIVKNHLDFNSMYRVEFSRQTIGTNLKDYEDPFQEEFSKSCRKKIRKLLKESQTYRIIEKPKDISKFLKFYYSTMDRNKADDYYYFDQSYFEKFLDKYRDNIIIVEVLYQNKIIAMGFYFLYNDYIHIHLSGTLSEYLDKSPAYILRYGITVWGKENGYSLIHHGGGRNSDPEDGLFKFKKQFGQNTTFDFYIGKKIWNQDIYNKICEMNNIDQNNEFFPSYRKKRI